MVKSIQIVYLPHQPRGGAPDDFINLDAEKKYDDEMYGPTTLYGMSKYGLIADARALSKKYPEINFLSMNPGPVASNFASNLGLAGTIYYFGFYFFQLVASQGAKATLRASLDPDFNTVKSLQGAYLHSDGNPLHPDAMKTINPKTKKVYGSIAEYGVALLEATDKLIKQLLEKKKE